jgi:SAM-dependent methyltransferase
VKYVNLGCGTRYHSDWINYDAQPAGPTVIRHDVTRGIPLQDQSADVVYHSHILEHLRPDDARRMLHECRRVLRSGGIVRVATPDLERLAATYLQRIAAWRAGESGAADDLDWLRLELLDQVSREESGGSMAAYLRNPPNASFVYSRIGEEARRITADDSRTLLEKIRRAGVARAAAAAASKAVTGLRRGLVRLALGAGGLRAYDIGRFRLSGEVHHWLYDEQSLSVLLREAGFVDAAVRTATSSSIPGWESFHLDALGDGTAIKPDSFFMEARRP